jgi:hypothetical protein
MPITLNPGASEPIRRDTCPGETAIGAAYPGHGREVQRQELAMKQREAQSVLQSSDTISAYP